VIFATNANGALIELSRLYNLPSTWTLMTSGSFCGGPFEDILCYDRQAGEVEFYSSDGQGGLTLQTRWQGWRGPRCHHWRLRAFCEAYND
ncbi:MAG: hypothetical protein JXA14_03655, partial [Anaerolineae bacterium]|nr:hypothetical protein [Anaerolineae bacterium]